MRVTNVLLVVLGLALGLALAVAVLLTVGEAKLLPAIQTIGSIATAFAAIVAFAVYLSTVRRHQQEDSRKASAIYMGEALSVLEKAYETLIQQGDNPPANSRLLWLSTARMIVRFQKLREKVTDPDHTKVVDENEENIRLKFSILLRRNSANFTREYFCAGNNQYDGDNIHRKSMAVIFGFSRWREDIPDPLDPIDDIELFASGALPIDQFGAKSYLEDFPEYWAKVQTRKDSHLV
ncbi:MAG: hypothetical protein A2045_06245 [Rhodocyclales bacterium GWA2_65_20]|nr:MAG: hypothetical protein A2045_06245 [Rhodocyclales bacterium GWA2_65_20]